MKYNKLLKNLLIIMGFIIIVSSNVFVQIFSNLDEIWIFNFGKNIVDGLLPYKDFNLIITPLFPYICAFFLKIFGSEMIVLRFLEVIQTAVILFLIYKILEQLKVNKSVSLIFVIGLYYFNYTEFCFDYNWAAFLITLIVLYNEIKYAEKNINLNLKTNILLGILVRSSNTFKADNRNNTCCNICDVQNILIKKYKRIYAYIFYKNFRNTDSNLCICNIFNN